MKGQLSKSHSTSLGYFTLLTQVGSSMLRYTSYIVIPESPITPDTPVTPLHQLHRVSVSAYQRISVTAKQRTSVSAYQRVSMTAYRVPAHQRITLQACNLSRAECNSVPASNQVWTGSATTLIFSSKRRLCCSQMFLHAWPQESKDALSRGRTSTMSGEHRSSHCQSRKNSSPRWMTRQECFSESWTFKKRQGTGLYTKTFWHAKKNTHRCLFAENLSHRETFTHRSLCAEELLHRDARNSNKQTP